MSWGLFHISGCAPPLKPVSTVSGGQLNWIGLPEVWPTPKMLSIARYVAIGMRVKPAKGVKGWRGTGVDSAAPKCATGAHSRLAPRLRHMCGRGLQPRTWHVCDRASGVACKGVIGDVH